MRDSWGLHSWGVGLLWVALLVPAPDALLKIMELNPEINHSGREGVHLQTPKAPESPSRPLGRFL